MYVIRKTYKTTSAIQRCYQNVRFFRIAVFPSDKHFRRNKGKSRSAANQEMTRKTALEVLQMLRAKKDSSVFITSAARNESKTEVAVSLAREFAAFGKSVLILETDSDNTDISEHFGESEILPVHTLSALLQGGTDFESAADAIPDRSINVIIANHHIQDDFAPDMADVSRRILEHAKKIYDVILIDGCSWSASEHDRIWRETADASLAVCRQDQADFQAIDQMMTDLRENDPDFLGCVLYGF
jgi:Mrp family chromosome partitioning ATPase